MKKLDNCPRQTVVAAVTAVAAAAAAASDATNAICRARFSSIYTFHAPDRFSAIGIFGARRKREGLVSDFRDRRKSTYSASG